MTKIVDLSVELSPDYPCWFPGFEPFSATPTATLEEINVFTRMLHVEEHCGTHMDAACHVGDEDHRPFREVTSDQIPLDWMIGKARVIDARRVRGVTPGVSPAIELQLLEQCEDREGPITEGDIVLLWTGWSDEFYCRFPQGERYLVEPLAKKTPAWPAPSRELIEALAQRGVRTVGVDTPTIGAAQHSTLTHRVVFEAEITPIENLTNLGALVDRTATFMFLPLRVIDGSGAPGRAIALVADI